MFKSEDGHAVYGNERGRRILYKETAEARKTELSETPEKISLKNLRQLILGQSYITPCRTRQIDSVAVF